MLFLAGSIILSAYLILAFKMLQRLGLDLFQAIVFNYITCVITGSFVHGAFPIDNVAYSSGWFWWACGMGTVFIILFNLIGITTQRINVAVASVANKLSLIIPVVFSIYLYNESLSNIQWLGIVLVLVAVIFTCWPNRQTERKNTAQHFLLYLLPLVVFAGSGLLDTMIKYVETTYLNEVNQDAFLVTAFASAASIGLATLLLQVIRGKQVLSPKTILAGILIGVPNYFSIWCLIQFLKISPWPSSAAIPLNNLGIILFGSLVASIVFKERLSAINVAGIAVSILAIYFIAFGTTL
ncbi:EamA family transporter [Aridibaculum aurantiacum]|uniref:EamA family transporter n=1 Tax=Aridibaculum aurantiacum TaxID=2810307 RepID=UPI001A961999|nr:EamA family transporter [Aridibaculum aurantiacum]